MLDILNNTATQLVLASCLLFAVSYHWSLDQ